MTSYESLESRCQWLEEENEALKKRLARAEKVCRFTLRDWNRDELYLTETDRRALEAWRKGRK